MMQYLVLAIVFAFPAVVSSIELDVKDKPTWIKCLSECRVKYRTQPQEFLDCYKTCFSMIALFEGKIGGGGPDSSAGQSPSIESAQESVESQEPEERSLHEFGNTLESISESNKNRLADPEDVRSELGRLYQRVLERRLHQRPAEESVVEARAPQMENKRWFSSDSIGSWDVEKRNEEELNAFAEQLKSLRGNREQQRFN